MSNAPPIPFRWTGSSFEPVGRFGKECDRHFVVGEIYRLVELEERSIASHRQEFAWLHDAWLSLPEEIAANFSSEDELRKHALIRTGWCHRVEHVYPSKAEALRQAATIRQHKGEYCIVVVRDTLVTVLTARSQKMRGTGAMKKDEFQRSKSDIMEFIGAMLGVTADDLQRNGGRAA